jgi:type IV pilus assembly protein PilC
MEFEYKAVDRLGKVVSGKAEAGSRIEIITSLQNQGMTLLDLKDIVQEIPVETTATGRIDISFETGISEKTLIFFTRQFASTMKAGIPILRCINLLSGQTTSKRMKKVLEELSADIQRGKSLSEAMSAHDPPFGKLYRSMIKVGETTGNLAEVLENLADSLEAQYEIKRKVKSAMSYPVFILVFSFILVYLMMTQLMPGFMPIFRDSGLDIKHQYPVTQIMIDLSNELSSHWFLLVVIGAAVMLYLVYKALRANEKSRFIMDKMFFNFPVLKGFVQMRYFSQVANSLGTLMSSGIQIQESLGLAANATENLLVRKALYDTVENIEKGNGLSASMNRTKIFSEMMVQMISIGEESGNLDDMLFRVSDYYERELEGALTSITSLIEPIMMVVIGGVVFSFVIGIFLPIMGITQGIQQGIGK